MYRRPKKKLLGQEAIPTTPLADMMFLLLIFFIMTTTLAKVTGFVTDMPSGQKGDQSQKQKTTSVALHDEKIAFNDQNVSMDELYKLVKGLRLDQKVGDAKVVIVSAAGMVNYQNYFETMAIIQNSGGVVAIETEGK